MEEVWSHSLLCANVSFRRNSSWSKSRVAFNSFGCEQVILNGPLGNDMQIIGSTWASRPGIIWESVERRVGQREYVILAFCAVLVCRCWISIHQQSIFNETTRTYYRRLNHHNGLSAICPVAPFTFHLTATPILPFNCLTGDPNSFQTPSHYLHIALL